jgi:hypothetical protein
VFNDYVKEFSNWCINKHDEQNKLKYESLKRLIVQHQDILELIEKINSIFYLIGQTQLAVSNITISVTGYAVITVSNLTHYIQSDK